MTPGALINAVREAAETAAPRWLDWPLTALEIGARQIYWRSGRLPERYRKWREKAQPTLHVHRERLRERLAELGIGPGALVMVHASLQGVAWDGGEAGAEGTNDSLRVATELVKDLQSLVGQSGTLAMPTHPIYREDPGFMFDKRNLLLVYDPRRTPSGAGLLSEAFRRSPGVQRSLHPLSSLACQGPLADDLLRDNLNNERPLPHGVHSGYFRFCRSSGSVVSLNIPLIRALAVAHTAEEAREADWPVPGFFYERRFRVKTTADEREWIVRERHPRWARNIAIGQLRRDLLREGILRETRIGGLRVDSSNAGAVYGYMTERNKKTPYPYYGTSSFLTSRSG